MCKNVKDFIPYYFGLIFAFYAAVSLILSGMANGIDPVQAASSGAV